MKLCQTCGQADRYPNGRCRPCKRAREQQRRLDHPELKEAARLRGHTHPERRLESSKRWMRANWRRHQVMTNASHAVRRALRSGRLTKPTACEACGAGDRVIEGAHKDYARPLDVRWLCRPCHRAWDAREPKSVRLVTCKKCGQTYVYGTEHVCPGN
jgi:hypothetical protein